MTPPSPAWSRAKENILGFTPANEPGSQRLFQHDTTPRELGQEHGGILSQLKEFSTTRNYPWDKIPIPSFSLPHPGSTWSLHLLPGHFFPPIHEGSNPPLLPVLYHSKFRGNPAVFRGWDPWKASLGRRINRCLVPNPKCAFSLDIPGSGRIWDHPRCESREWLG